MYSWIFLVLAIVDFTSKLYAILGSLVAKRWKPQSSDLSTGFVFPSSGSGVICKPQCIRASAESSVSVTCLCLLQPVKWLGLAQFQHLVVWFGIMPEATRVSAQISRLGFWTQVIYNLLKAQMIADCFGCNKSIDLVFRVFIKETTWHSFQCIKCLHCPAVWEPKNETLQSHKYWKLDFQPGKDSWTLTYPDINFSNLYIYQELKS